ncbi:MAG: hypothetical protein U5J63_02070 [Fodinibius sp.]|nr:hypothetical protein [Fodinibius sp.]
MLLILAVGALLGFALMPTSLEAQPRERYSMDLDWRFTRGDVEEAKHPGFDDSDWRLLDVPRGLEISKVHLKNRIPPVAAGDICRPVSAGIAKHSRWNQRCWTRVSGCSSMVFT